MSTETYALAFDFAAPRLAISRVNGSVRLTWPVNQAGLILQESATLNPSSWANVEAPALLTNGHHTITMPQSGSIQYFRLFRP